MVLPRILEGLPLQFPLALPAEDLVAGHIEARECFAYEYRDDAEVLGNHPGGGVLEEREQPFPLCDLVRAISRQEGGAAVALADVSAEESDEVVHAVAVVQLRAATRA